MKHSIAMNKKRYRLLSGIFFRCSALCHLKICIWIILRFSFAQYILCCFSARRDCLHAIFSLLLRLVRIRHLICHLISCLIRAFIRASVRTLIDALILSARAVMAVLCLIITSVLTLVLCHLKFLLVLLPYFFLPSTLL